MVIFRKYAILSRLQHHRAGPNPLADLHTRREKHYAEVSKIFDDAIDAVRAKLATPRAALAVGTRPPPAALLKPRRSARIRNLLPIKQEHPPSVPVVPRSTKPSATPSPLLPTATRRSARLLKRRLEDADQHPDMPQSKARRSTAPL